MKVNIEKDARIHRHHGSIAQHNSENQSKLNLAGAIIDDIDGSDSFGAQFIEAYNLAESNQDVFADAPENGKEIYLNAVYEHADFNLKDSDISIEGISNAYQLDAGFSYNKKHKNGAQTNIKAYGRISETYDDYKIKFSDADDISDDEQVTSEELVSEDTVSDDNNEPITERTTDIHGFVAARHTLKNNDAFDGTTVFRYDGTSGDTKLAGSLAYTNRNWFGDKFDVKGQFDFTTYFNNAQDYEEGVKDERKTIANFEINLIPKTKNEEDNQSTAEDENSEAIDTEATGADQGNVENSELAEASETTLSKGKWTKIFYPTISVKNVDGDSEQGFGGVYRATRKTSDSNLTFGAMAKYSMTITPQDEENTKKYHSLTFGGNLNYKKDLGTGVFETGIKLADKYTFDKGNIFTSRATASYTSDKFLATAEAVYIKIPDSTYFGFDGRLEYTPKSNIRTYIEGTYINLKSPDSAKLNGYSVQAGFAVLF